MNVETAESYFFFLAKGRNARHLYFEYTEQSEVPSGCYKLFREFLFTALARVIDSY